MYSILCYCNGRGRLHVIIILHAYGINEINAERKYASFDCAHLQSTGHKVDLTKARVIDGHPQVTPHCWIESNTIIQFLQRHSDTLNQDKGVHMLYTV